MVKNKKDLLCNIIVTEAIADLALSELDVGKFTNSNVSIKLERGEVFNDYEPYVYFLEQGQSIRKFIYKPKILSKYYRMVKLSIDEDALSKDYVILSESDVISEYIAALDANPMLPDVIQETDNFIEIPYYEGLPVDRTILYDKDFQLQLREGIVHSMNKKVRVDIDFYGQNNIIFDTNTKQYRVIDSGNAFPVPTYWCKILEMGAMKWWFKNKCIFLYLDTLNIHNIPFEKVKEKIINRYGREYQILKNISKRQIEILDKIDKRNNDIIIL